MSNKADYPLWPDDFLCSLPALRSPSSFEREKRLQQRISELDLPAGVAGRLCRLYYPLAVYLEHRITNSVSPVVLGVNGAQGTGKSTAAVILQILLEQLFNRRVCAISIDDLYLSREARRELANAVHPLLRTRGVPGTHDLELGLNTLESLRKAGSHTRTVIPRFDKARDQPCPESAHEVFAGRPDCILFEGWCVGAVPEEAAALDVPANDLERLEDSDGRWRRYVNRRLAEYQPLFGKIDILAMLKAPSFAKVREWRALQESKLASGLPEIERRKSRIMSNEELNRFLMHYARLTQWMLKEIPNHADFIFELNDKHDMEKIIVNVGRQAP